MKSVPRFVPDRPRSRVLVAGAAGFIGSHLCERLLGQGHYVIAVDNLVTGDWSNLAGLMGRPRFSFVLHDVIRPLQHPGPIDWILHFASPASPRSYQAHPIETLRANAEGTWRLLSLARREGASFLLASTSEVYGDPDQHPQRADYWGNVNPIGPRSVYDEGKRYAEALTLSAHQSRKQPVRIVRIFNTYGPRMQPDDGRVVTNFVTQALNGEPITVNGDGSQTRSLQYVTDVVDGVLRTMAADVTGPVNLGNPHECTMLELAQRVKALSGSDSPIVHRPMPPDDPRRRCPDITLAREVLGWQPKVGLDSGLERTIAWYRERGRMHRVTRPAVARQVANGGRASTATGAWWQATS